MDTQYQQEILASALTARTREVTEYQINIDNYRLAIERISDNDEEMLPFKRQLEELLRSSIIEQRKAQIMLEVIQSQISDGSALQDPTPTE